jgi:hypothetical protein
MVEAQAWQGNYVLAGAQTAWLFEGSARKEYDSLCCGGVSVCDGLGCGAALVFARGDMGTAGLRCIYLLTVHNERRL